MGNKTTQQVRPGQKLSKDKHRPLVEEGEDTSHDAGELNSQESSGEPVAPCEANSGIKKQFQEGFVNFKTKTTACDIHQSEEKENYSKKTIGVPACHFR